MLQFTASFPFWQCPLPSTRGSVVVNTAPVTGPLVWAGLWVGESALGETGDELSLHARATASVVAAAAKRYRLRMVFSNAPSRRLASPADASSSARQSSRVT